MQGRVFAAATALALAACQPPAPPAPPAPPQAPAPPAAAAAAAAPTPAPGVSFDCAKATDATEKLVCADSELGALDGRLAKEYAGAEARGGDPDLAATQRGWIKGRNDCWKAADPRQCVLEAYQTRLVELQIARGAQVVPAPVEYACGDNSQPFTAVFYNDIDPRSAVLTYGGNSQAIVFALPAASGTKYGRDGVEFREHQGEVIVSWYGTGLKCTVPGH